MGNPAYALEDFTGNESNVICTHITVLWENEEIHSNTALKIFCPKVQIVSVLLKYLHHQVFFTSGVSKFKYQVQTIKMFHIDLLINSKGEKIRHLHHNLKCARKLFRINIYFHITFLSCEKHNILVTFTHYLNFAINYIQAIH